MIQNALTLNLDPPDARCDSVVLQEAFVPDKSELVAIPINTDGLTSTPWVVEYSQHYIIWHTTQYDKKKVANLI